LPGTGGKSLFLRGVIRKTDNPIFLPALWTKLDPLFYGWLYGAVPKLQFLEQAHISYKLRTMKAKKVNKKTLNDVSSLFFAANPRFDCFQSAHWGLKPLHSAILWSFGAKRFITQPLSSRSE
jgi:hypothetical protein